MLEVKNLYYVVLKSAYQALEQETLLFSYDVKGPIQSYASC